MENYGSRYVIKNRVMVIDGYRLRQYTEDIYEQLIEQLN